MDLRCSKGHISTDPDYCSECGTKMTGAPSAIPAAATPAAAPAAGEACPVCATPRLAAARFCEVCRYDFEGTTAPAVKAPAPAALPNQAPATAPPASEPVHQRWETIIAVDPSLYREPDPALPCPTGQPERIFPLDMDDNLVGRRDDHRAIRPEIMIVDPGVSHRHLSLRRRADGGFCALELGSTNGTMLNDTTLEPGVETPLANGDQLILGCWTRITIRAR
jgi:FHA domain